MRTCWQIRQALSAAPDEPSALAEGPSTQWVLECADCTVYASGVSCWEQGRGDQRCCAPVHLTCDFCALYIEHRREVTALIQSVEPPAPHSDALRRNHPEGGPSVIMEKLQLNIPAMYADHHVLKARSALTALAGVQEVIASSAFRLVSVTFDPATVTPEAIRTTLAKAGYAVDDNGAGVAPHVMPMQTRQKDPAWDRLGIRVSKTDTRDAKLSR